MSDTILTREYFDLNEVDTATEAPAWKIEDDLMADWALRKVQEERAENKRLHDIADEQIAEIEAMADAADRRLESRTAFLLGCLKRYFGQVPHKSTKTQEQYQLLSGKLVMTLPKETMSAPEDTEGFVKWLKDSGRTDYVQTVEKPKWGDFKKTLTIMGGKAVDTETGEVIDMVTVTPTEEKFDIK